MTQHFFAAEAYAKLQDENPVTLLAQAMNNAHAAGHTFGADTVMDALRDLEAEVAELREEMEKAEPCPKHLRNELGDCFLSLINVCRFYEMDVDDVLQKVAERWLARKKLQEEKIQAAGYTWSTAPWEVSHQAWVEVKKELSESEYL